MLIFSFPAQILPFAHAFGRILNYIFRKTIYISVLIGLCVSLLLYKTGKTAVIRLHVREHYALIVGGIMHVQFSGSESLKRFYACAAVDLHAEHIYFALYGAVLIPDLIDRILEFSRPARGFPGEGSRCGDARSRGDAGTLPPCRGCRFFRRDDRCFQRAF